MSAEDLRQHMATNHRLLNSSYTSPVDGDVLNGDAWGMTNRILNNNNTNGETLEPIEITPNGGTEDLPQHEYVAGTSAMKAVAVFDGLPMDISYNSDNLNGQTGTSEPVSVSKQMPEGVTVIANTPEQVTVS